MTEHSSNPYFVEQELQNFFKGIRIVGEIDLSQAGPVYVKAKDVVRKVIQSGSLTKLNQYPASTTIFLTAEGARGYDEGTFWPNIEVLDGLTPPQQSAVGKAFRSALTRLGLETFEGPASAERWLTNVSPILMHGGIPATYASDVARLVYWGLRKGIWDADNLIDRVRQSSAQWSKLAKPVKRFLKYGDEFACDLLQRMIDIAADIGHHGQDTVDFMAELSANAGLPQYLTKALLEGDLGSPKRGQRPPSPTIRIDRYSCEGPYMVLPSFSHKGVWVIRGASTYRCSTRKHDSVDIQLAPSHGWTAILRWNEHSEARQSERHFAGLERVHAYVFDGSGKLMSQQHQIRADQTLILTPPEGDVTDENGSPIRRIEELPPRIGPWSGWTLWNLDLNGVSLVHVKSPTGLGEGEDVAVLRVAQPLARPEVKTQPVNGCRGHHGGKVFAEPPRIKLPGDVDPAGWRASWHPTIDHEMVEEDFDSQAYVTPTNCKLVDLPHLENEFSLGPLLPSDPAFSGTVKVSGPLGSDMRETVSVIRGLQADVPDRICGPRELVSVPISAEAQLYLDNGLEVRETSLMFEAGQDTIPFKAGGTEVAVTIPRLAWALQRTDGSFPTLGVEQLRVGLDEIESGAVGSVLVRCGRPSTLWLELRGSTSLQKVGPVQANGSDGRWSFSLAEFRTTIDASPFPRLDLVLHAGDLKERIAVIEAQFEPCNLHVATEFDAETYECIIEAEWTENRQFAGRQLRLWSVHRPWDNPVCAEVENDSAGRCDAIVELLPGPYLAEIVVADEWATPPRPNHNQAGVSSLVVGSYQHQRHRLEGLDANAPLDALELAVSGAARASGLDIGAAATASSEFACAFEIVAEFEEADASAISTLFDLVDLALASEGVLPRLAPNLIGLPHKALWRIKAIFVAEVRDPHELTAEELELLWNTLPTVAAALDNPFRHGQERSNNELSEASFERWERFSGWRPDPDTETLTGRLVPVTPPLDDFGPARLRLLQQTLPPYDSLPLQWGGWLEAGFEMLSRTWDDLDTQLGLPPSPERESVKRWRSSYHAIHQYTQKFSACQRTQHHLLQPASGRPAWHNFPADILAAAFHLIDDTASRADVTRAAIALSDAAEIAPLLTRRNILLALGLKHLENAEKGNCD